MDARVIRPSRRSSSVTSCSGAMKPSSYSIIGLGKGVLICFGTDDGQEVAVAPARLTVYVCHHAEMRSASSMPSSGGNILPKDVTIDSSGILADEYDFSLTRSKRRCAEVDHSLFLLHAP